MKKLLALISLFLFANQASARCAEDYMIEN